MVQAFVRYNILCEKSLTKLMRINYVTNVNLRRKIVVNISEAQKTKNFVQKKSDR
ncbi:hypothetical protein LY28_00295 [Ruminiclostridium sufflavum DSM 19573]|uniref:Uncharacterized protein n=1 Tax=Ruminiclostridium sufflavum DSM 19573 TaxID=1121337 RepID=A0A318XQV6_9FIRM|nr:hypothetical protein LY28_00295 [Ruminiclostridium sufflavum DSM 19573]